MIKKALLLTATTSLLMQSASVFAADSLELKVSRLGDVELACGELSREAVIMRDIVFTTQDIKDDTKIKSAGVGVAGAAASFLIGTATGGIGLAAAGFLMDRNFDETTEQAEGVQDLAQQRRSLMMGIYNAKGCYGPMEHAMQDPVPLDFMELASIEPAAGREVSEKPSYNE